MKSSADKLELTKRQRDILTMAANSKCDKEIADKLKISVHTVNSHFRIIYKKLGKNTRAAACVRLAISNPDQLALKLG